MWRCAQDLGRSQSSPLPDSESGPFLWAGHSRAAHEACSFGMGAGSESGLGLRILLLAST